MKSTEEETLISCKGILLITFISDNSEAKKAKLFKRLFAQRVIKNGLTLQEFNRHIGGFKVKGATPLEKVLAYIESLVNDGKRTESFVNWLYEHSYLSDQDVIEVMGGRIVNKPEPPKSKYIAPASLEEKKKYSAWVQVQGVANNNGFTITLGLDGKEFPYPNVMEIEEALDCVGFIQERFKIPWEAVIIPVADLLRQADRSTTCRRMLNKLKEEGMSIDKLLG